MCGIAGFAGENDLVLARQRVETMTHRIAHRGPDAAGYFVREQIAFGHRRLSIIDLSEVSNQPMTDPSGRYTLIFNGEIYNFREVREELIALGYVFHTQGDTEVILAAYIEWGSESVHRLNGMFVYAVWDDLEKSLWMVRDRLGIKPVYYTYAGGKLIFSSEVRSLLSSGYVQGKINQRGLAEYLQYYTVHAPETLLEGVRMLPPGYSLRWQAGQIQTEAFWKLTGYSHKAEGQTYQEVCAEVRELLRAAVMRRLISDVPFGAFLSGGIDSSAIVALMAEGSTQQVNTFSVVFDEKEYDESVYAEMIARKYNTLHHPIKLRPSDFLEELPHALEAMDHPSGDGLNSYVVSQATKKSGFTVALSGLGGDELFAGYPVFKRYQKLRQLAPLFALPLGLRKGVAQLAGALYRNHKTARLQEILTLPKNDFRNSYPIFRKVFDPAEIQGLLKEAPKEVHLLEQIFSEGELEQISHMPVFSQVSVGEIATYTQNVLLRDTDQMSMAHALEVRVPFFDYTLVEYSLGIPDVFKNPVYPKKLLVDAMGTLLPHEIVFRKKMGFSFPWRQWLQGELRDFCGASLKSLGKRPLFAPGAVEALWERFLRNDPSTSWIKIWMLVVLEDWMKRNDIHE
ncbi:MAG: asparagine synthase (glutamine-hydrolyzing) [Bacteroidetes bacterium]|nr:MAG: asparagine synthase (glutamine-hydrolyzing) [Bacteroidota bacterium]